MWLIWYLHHEFSIQVASAGLFHPNRAVVAFSAGLVLLPHIFAVQDYTLYQIYYGSLALNGETVGVETWGGPWSIYGTE